MDNDEYTAHMDVLVTTVRCMATLPINELCEIADKVETLGPILEPTAYQRGGGRRLDEQRRLLAAAAKLVRVFREIEQENAVGAR